jgi:hypothetical protein
MDTKMIAKRTSLDESGLLSAREWANSLLYDLVSAPELDTAFVSSLDLLPHEVGQEFPSLLARIEEADFHWTPSFLTSSTAPSDPTKSSAQLRQICALLEQGRADGVDPRRTELGNRETIRAARASGQDGPRAARGRAALVG